MTFNAIVWKMMKRNIRRYLLYLASNCFAILFSFLFFSIYYNRHIEQMKESDSFDSLLAIPKVALLMFMFLFIQYSHQLFIKKRKSELGLFMAIGMSPRNIGWLITIESFFISIVALFLGLIGGSIFSKLFYLIFTYFSKLSHEFYHLSFKMVSYTIISYLLIFWITVIITNVQIRNQSFLTSIQSEKIIDVTKTNKTYFQYIGLFLLLISIVGLYLTYTTQGDLLFLWVFLTFFGLYLFLSSFIHLMIHVIKQQPFIYYRSILLFSSLEQKQKKLTSLLTLTSIMIMITTLYSTIMLSTAKLEYEQFIIDHPTDIAFIENKYNNVISEEALFNLFDKEKNPIVSIHKLPVVEIWKEDYFDGKNYYNIISLHDYNRLVKGNFNLTEDEFLLFVNEQSETIGDLDNIPFFEIANLKLTQQNKKIDKLLTRIGQSSVFIIVHPNVWEQLTQDATMEIFIHNYIQVINWKDSLPVVEKLQQIFKQDNKEVYDSTEGTLFHIFSKIEGYTQNKKENAILFYLMSFLSIVFYFGSFLLLYFNLIADIDLEQKKFKKLYKIGITKKEIKQQLTIETFILFFLPTFLGIILAFLYIAAMSQDIGGLSSNLEIIRYFIVMGGIYCFIQFCFFLYAKSKLFSKIWMSLRKE